MMKIVSSHQSEESQDYGQCKHCGLQITDSVTEKESLFCCVGCQTAYNVIQGYGLSLFYQRMVRNSKARILKPESHDLPSLDEIILTPKDGHYEINLMVEGLHCTACVWLIESILARDNDILVGRVNFTTHRLRILWQGDTSKAQDFIRIIEQLGFRLIPFDPKRLGLNKDNILKDLLISMAVAAFAASNVMLLSVSVWAGHSGSMGSGTKDLLHWLSALIGMPAILYAGRPFFKSALQALLAGRTNMDVPISVGLLLTTLMSLSETIHHASYVYFDSALTLELFLLIGRVLDHRARGRTREAAEHLLSLGTATAHKIQDNDEIISVSSCQLRPGDHILVSRGEKIPADGLIIKGRSELDVSLVTGESAPHFVESDDTVFAGTLNLIHPLTIKVSASGENTLLAEIVRLMEAAEEGRMGYRLLTDKISTWYSPFIHLLALATFLYWFLYDNSSWQVALLRAVSVLIITCPCALALAVPVVQVVSNGRLFRQGIFLKSATALERLAQVNHIVFDKTGTLTRGEFSLEDPHQFSESETLLAISLAHYSHHPLSKSLVGELRKDSKKYSKLKILNDIEELPGLGLQASYAGQTLKLGSRRWFHIEESMSDKAELWFKYGTKKPLCFSFKTRLRADTKETLKGLKKLGITLSILSGDREPAVKKIASELEIEDWHAQKSPSEKVEFIRNIQKNQSIVLMVGDGLNDAPALAMAHVSLSPSNAADISQNSADAIFQGHSLKPILEIITVARKAAKLVRSNIIIALLYNFCAVPLAVIGWVTPPVAAIAMSSSSLIVILNALRMVKNNAK
jgi:Cu2+-exporting ATPase